MGISTFEKRPFQEMIILVIFMLILAFFFPQFKETLGLFPIAYYLVELRVRGKNRQDPGFKNPLPDLKKNWHWIVLVGIVLQIFYVLIYRNYFPDMFNHLSERVSFIQTFDVNLILKLVVLALGEEIAFRGLVQGRLQWAMKPSYAILVTSVIFAIMHISSGTIEIVALDLTSIFIDSIVFGIIFYKTRNIYASTIAHALANIVAAYMMVNI